MTPSIRARLLLWMIGAMAVLLAVFAMMVYGVMYRSLMNGFDAVLASTARTICGSVEQGKEMVKVEIDEREMPEFHRATKPDYLQLWRQDGQSLIRSPGLNQSDLQRFDGPIGLPVFRPMRLPDGRPGRAVSLLFVPKIDDEVKEAITPQTVTLVVARETAAVDSEIRFLQWLLAAATGGTIILALLVGAVVVRQGLMPLNDLAARIAAIRQDDLSTQIATDRMPAEMAPVVQRLNDLLRRLEQAFQRERAFTADAAHELRTPLAGVRSTLEVSLSRTRAGEDYRQAMTECLDIVGHMQTMVDNLLALARLEGRQTALRFETLLLGELIEAIWRPMSVTARRRGIAVKTDLPADLACHADRDILAMTLTNLLANASEYTDDGGRIEVIARRQGESVELALANTGCRLSAEDARHVFERFWRADPSRTDTGLHCGLGLVLVQRAVTSLGGTVAAGVADGVFTVRLVLPAARTA
jgi:two-component system sensor histidine kinase QseC